MRATGIVRKTDYVGRVVIPIELRRTHGFGEHQKLELYVDGDKIVIMKCHEQCIFCGISEGLAAFDCKLVCVNCLKYISSVTNSEGYHAQTH